MSLTRCSGAARLLVALGLLLAAPVAADWGPHPGTPAPGGGGGPGTAAVAGDPVGDNFNSMVHDIVQYSASTDGVNLNLQIDFNNPVSAPGSGQPDEIFGYIDIDSDQNAGTGVLPWVDIFCPFASGLGTDYFVAMFGSGLLVDSTFTPVGPVTVSASGNSLGVHIPLALLGGDDGVVNTATVIGDFVGPNDCAPDGTFLTSDAMAVPTLGQAGLVVLMLLLLSVGVLVVRRAPAS